MTEKQIKAIRSTLPNVYQPRTEEQRKVENELRCREMVNSILIYDFLPTDVDESTIAKVANNRYMQSYREKIDAQRINEIVAEQIEDYKHCKVGFAGTDCEGLSYNYCLWADDERYVKSR
jgi:hypothetical protein